MSPDAFYDWAVADAERRGLSDLKPVLDALRAASRHLREAAWNDDPRADALDTPDAPGAPESREPADDAATPNTPGTNAPATSAGAAGAALTNVAETGAAGTSATREAATGEAATRAAAANEVPTGAAATDAASIAGSADERVDPAMLTIVQAARMLRAGRLTSVALTEACLARIARDNPRLNAFITITADSARAQAANADRERAAGQDRGALHGIPIALKDLVDVEGLPTTAASHVRAGHVARHDAPIVAHLRRAGAVFVGKTNLHEFAMGTTNEESAYGAAHHPLDETRSPGGSSGGSAIAVATGMSLAAVGSDTGGSIRIPSAACGLVGLKPRFGELSCDGVVPLSHTLDHVGPMARTVADAWLLYEAMAGRRADLDAIATPASDTRDGATPNAHAPRASGRAPRSPSADEPLPDTGVRSGLRAGIPEDYFLDRLQTDVRASFEDAIARLRAAGVVIDRVELPAVRDAAAMYLPIVLAEAAAYHARGLDASPDAYTAPVRTRFQAGRYVLAEDYLRARRGADRLRAEVDAALASRDLLLVPTLPIVAPPLGANTVPVGNRDEPVRGAMLRLTQPFNLTGHPAATLPIRPATDGLPCGLQLIACDTHALLRTAAWCEGVLRSRHDR